MTKQRITRPRRQHPGTMFAESDVAESFRQRIHEMVGPKLEYVPVAQFGSGHNAWLVHGPRGRGLLAEAEDGPQPHGIFRTRAVFVGHAWSTFPVQVGTLAMHGWDPGLAAEQGEPIPKMSDRRRYKLRDERSAEVAVRLDAQAWTNWDPDGSPDGVGDFPKDVLVTLLNRHVMAASPPPAIERNDRYMAAYYSCYYCEWWGRGSALVELRLDGGGVRLMCPKCETLLSTPTD